MKNDIVEILAGQFSDYIKENGITSAVEVSALMRNLFDKIHENMIVDVEISQITSPNIVAEVIDEKTGLLFRRYLEIEYSENSNGLIISGENIKGEKSEIVFLSETAVSRISELKGSGSDNPHCS
ncbi:MAG: hypothetical protein LBV03_00605 [Fusobacteriales bacterium]|jgi:hypothetical protein|nr:hypothetical protein [Fusobacteriales bacterium]